MTGGYQASAQRVFSKGLQDVSAGWVDQELVTVRKMAAAGATGDEIGAAIGKSLAQVNGIVRRNHLVWNRRAITDRHLIASAGAIAGHENMGHAQWVKEATALYLGGMHIRDVAEKLGVPYGTVHTYFHRMGIKPSEPPKRQRKRMASRQKMLALIIRLHVEEVLSEGQVQAATGLDRQEIRRLYDEARPQ